MLFLFLSCVPFGGYQPSQTKQDYIAVKNTRYVFISKEFSYQDRIAIDKAINKWNFALNDQISFMPIDIAYTMSSDEIQNITNTRNIIVFKIDGKSNLLRKGDIKTIAFSNKIGGNGIFLVRSRIKDNDLTDVVVHEISHCLGSQHLAGSLMNEDFDSKLYRCIDFKTIEQVSKFEHLELSNMNYC